MCRHGCAFRSCCCPRLRSRAWVGNRVPSRCYAAAATALVGLAQPLKPFRVVLSLPCLLQVLSHAASGRWCFVTVPTPSHFFHFVLFSVYPQEKKRNPGSTLYSEATLAFHCHLQDPDGAVARECRLTFFSVAFPFSTFCWFVSQVRFYSAVFRAPSFFFYQKDKAYSTTALCCPPLSVHRTPRFIAKHVLVTKPVDARKPRIYTSSGQTCSVIFELGLIYGGVSARILDSPRISSVVGQHVDFRVRHDSDYCVENETTEPANGRFCDC